MPSHRPQAHFLIISWPVQSHVGPSLALAHRILSLTPSAHVTFSTTSSASRHLRPSPCSGNLTLSPYPDDYVSSSASSPPSLSQFLHQLAAAGGPPFTCVIYTILLSWANDVALSLGVPAIQFWIQPATVFATFFHFFHLENYSDVVDFPLYLPKLPPMHSRDLPSFLVDSSDDDKHAQDILSRFIDLFKKLDHEIAIKKTAPKILTNTFDSLEEEALTSSVGEVELIPIGPVLPPPEAGEEGSVSLFTLDEKKYMEWLDAKPKGSVVYVSFGSITVLKMRQMEEIKRGLRASGRPYLWVVRKDNRGELDDDGGDDEENGMVVEWCSQRRVLGHGAVGCFVTHCGWNSTMESLVAGLPMVGVPLWADQTTNAMLVEEVWGVGVRGVVDGEGVLLGEELERCLEVVMGEGERGRGIRRSAGVWREKAAEAAAEGGAAERNLKGFLEEYL